MQSSARNRRRARLKTSSHSRGVASVAVDKREPAEPRLSVALTPAPGEQAHRGADSARDEEACAERAGGDHRELRAQRRADAGTERVDGVGELVALRLDLSANLFRS